MISKGSKIIMTEGVGLPEGIIAEAQDNYKHLEVLQVNGNHKVVTRKSATTKYLQRVRGPDKPV